MKRQLRALLLTAVLSVCLFLTAGCGSADPGETERIPDAEETSAPETEAPDAETDGTETENKEAMNNADNKTPEKSWPRAEEKPFNRLSVTYSSEGPAKLTVSYTVFGKVREDVFYLEAGEDAVFSALIEPYLKGHIAQTPKILSAAPLRKGDAEPIITAFTTEEIPVYAKDVLYLEGSRYKVGIKLSWGGGISEIWDRDNPVEGLGNLCNNCDTGRLIQQSYYGTGANGEYTPGEFNGSVWSYNPVQGGNKYNQPSRIIDVQVGEDSVTVKAQPGDWSTRDFLTPSYMENTYTVSEDWIRIDNRFVDFSGWDNPPRSQEIPAFYTVSWLDAFVRYAGSSSWTGDALTWERSLPFWGDASVHDRCVFPLESGQSETWCAWVNEAADYGIGLYVPGADILLAGRHAYNGSKDPADGATNYVAPLETFAITSYRPVVYSSLITTGSVSAIRATFAENRDFTDNAFLASGSGRKLTADYRTLDFSSPVAMAAFKDPVNNTTSSFDEAEGAVCLTADTGFDPYIGIGYGASSPVLDAEDFGTVRITYKIPEENWDAEYGAELFLCAGDTWEPTAGRSVRVTGLPADGEWHTAEIPLTGDFWKGDIHLIRFDFFDACADGDRMFVKKIELLP